MEKEPIIFFSSMDELVKVGQRWQKLLYLTDWIIKFQFGQPEHYPDEDGHSEVIFSLKQAEIFIIRPTNEIGTVMNRVTKYCEEATLVHELLHCYYNLIEPDPSDIIVSYYEDKRHQLVEQMSKSLILAKYDLQPSWFKNF